jgi:hypothetical protein
MERVLHVKTISSTELDFSELLKKHEGVEETADAGSASRD